MREPIDRTSSPPPTQPAGLASALRGGLDAAAVAEPVAAVAAVAAVGSETLSAPLLGGLGPAVGSGGDPVADPYGSGSYQRGAYQDGQRATSNGLL